MATSTLFPNMAPALADATDRPALTVLVACPDARPPAYEAVAGLAKAGLLQGFLTATYHGGDGPLATIGRRLAPARFGRVERLLRRRYHPEIPAVRVTSRPWVDLALAAEGRLARHWPAARRAVARARTDRFDRAVARTLERERPEVAFLFSDVGSEHALPACKRSGIASVLSMVHGDVREEREVLEREAEASPEFMPIYLGDGALDLRELEWIHRRRLRDIALADRVLVPSEHIAATLERHGTPRERLAVVPYAADTTRFLPAPGKRHDARSCTFLFAGGITQRKGIKYLLEAWRCIRRPGWRLQLLGPLPSDPGPLAEHLDGVELLGRVGHAEVPARMAGADVFVFPSLFEGSAVVTYEALACGLPAIVTPSAGSVARDGIEALIVPPADSNALATAMERLGNDPDLRAAFAVASRARAEAFGWPRYHMAINKEISNLKFQI